MIIIQRDPIKSNQDAVIYLSFVRVNVQKLYFILITMTINLSIVEDKAEEAHGGILCRNQLIILFIPLLLFVVAILSQGVRISHGLIYLSL